MHAAPHLLCITPIIHFQSTAVQLSFPSDKLYKVYRDLSALNNVKVLPLGVCECNAILYTKYIRIKIVFLNGFLHFHKWIYENVCYLIQLF